MNCSGYAKFIHLFNEKNVGTLKCKSYSFHPTIQELFGCVSNQKLKGHFMVGPTNYLKRTKVLKFV